MKTNNHSNTAYIPKTSRKSYKILAYTLSLLTVIIPVAPSFAAQLADGQIQYEFDLDPVYERFDSPEFQYRAPSYIESSTPSAASIGEFHGNIEVEHKAGLGEPVWVPISGDITFFVPTYPQYKYIGTPLVQSRYIRTQINALLGRTLIDSTNSLYETEVDQLNTLYDNALSYIKNTPGLTFGDKLNRDQDGSGLSQDIVWPELRTVNGEDVIVPVVYLTQSTIGQQRVERNETTFNGNVSVGSLTIEDVTINTGRESFIRVANSLVNNGGTVSSPGDLKIITGGTFANLSGLVEASDGDLVIGAHSVQNRTIVHRYDTGSSQGHRFGDIASIDASNGSVVLRSYSDIVFTGSNASAPDGSLSLVADGSIYLGPEQLFSGSQNQYSFFESSRSEVSYLQSHLSAEDTIELIANGEIRLDAASIVSDQGHIELLAGLGIQIESVMEQSQFYFHGQFGRTTRTISSYKTTAIRTLLDAGEDIVLRTAFGDISLRAAELSAQETSFDAIGGGINLLMAVETDQYNYSAFSEGMFTISSTTRGHEIETAVPTTIVGGVQAESLYGLTVEYEGDPDATLNEQIETLSQIEGLEWMADIRSNPDFQDVNWEEVDTIYEEWDKTEKALGPLAIAIIIIIVSVCTMGAGSSMIGAAGTTGAGTTGAVSTAGAMMNAGFTAMVTAATIATANAALNGADFGESVEAGFEAVHDDEGLKSVAIAMVTAGVIHSIDAQFFNPDATELQNVGNAAYIRAIERGATESQALILANEAINAASAMTLGAQALQVLAHSTASAAIQTLINDERLGEFSEYFQSALLQNSVNVIGEYLTGKIASADSNFVFEYMAYAATACISGAALSSDDEETDSESACLTSAGMSLIESLLSSTWDPEVDELEADQREVADWLQTNITTDVALADVDDIGAMINDGLLPKETLLNVSEFSRIRAELTNITQSGASASRLLATVGAYIVGAGAAEVSIGEGLVSVQSWAGFNEHSNEVRNAAFIHEILSQQELITTLETQSYSAAQLAEEGLIPSEMIFVPLESDDVVPEGMISTEESLNVFVTGTDLAFFGLLHDLEADLASGNPYQSQISEEALESLAEVYDYNEQIGTSFIWNLRTVAFREGVEEALFQFDRDITIAVEIGNVTNEEELRWILGHYQARFEELRATTHVLDLYQAPGLIVRLSARAAIDAAGTVTDGIGAGLSYMAKKAKVTSILDAVVGLSTSARGALKTLLLRNPKLLDAMADNPALANAWKILDSSGFDGAIKKSLDNLEDVNDYLLRNPDGEVSLTEALTNGLRNSTDDISHLNGRSALPQEILDSAVKIKLHRLDINRPSSGNFGYLEGEVAGVQVDARMWSSGPADIATEPQIFEAVEVGWLRNTDSEYKMLNRLADDLGGVSGNTYPSITGTLRIVSERAYCASCQGVIQQFNNMFPNINLVLIDGVR
ncbi:MAG: DUF637 domain-containing protein [Agarilytica sp.]